MKRAFLLVILIAASLGLAQTPSAQKKPLDEGQVLAMLAGGVPSQRIAALVDKRGISFEPTEDYLTTLKKMGAEDVLLMTLRVTKRTKADTRPAKVAPKSEPVQKPLPQNADLEMSKEFRKAAMSAWLAIKKHGNNSSAESETSYESFADEAKQTRMLAKAEVVTTADMRVYIHLLRFDNLALEMRTQYEKLVLMRTVGASLTPRDDANIDGLHDRFRECGDVLGDILSGTKPVGAGGSACETSGP
jgi:hypothetical protein